MNKLYYKKPAKLWRQALPIGNGLMGLMVYGGEKTENLAVNDGTLWSGYPKEQDNAGSLKYLDEVRKLIFDGKNKEADKLAEQKLIGHYSESFLPLGMIKMRFSKSVKSGYKRELDLSTAIHTVSGGGIERESFVSYPNKVAVYNISAGKKLDFVISLSSKLRGSVVTDETISFVGQAPDYVAPNYLHGEVNPVRYNEKKGMSFCMRIEVVTDGEKIVCGDKLRIVGAKNSCVYIVTATGFNGFNKMPDTDCKSVVEKCKASLAAIEKNYEKIKSAHIADFTAIASKQSIKIAADSSLTTDTLVKNAKSGKADNALVELLYNYGKYMTIAGSRKGGQALNLQGLWNNSVRPPWSSNYTANINAEMNYWGASSSNLAECIEPYINMISECVIRGEKTARINYGAEGFACNHNVDIWRKTAPVQGNANYMFAPLCGVWLANELFEHLSYGELDEYKEKIYAAVSAAAKFANGFLVERDGHYVTCPSASPENVFVSNGNRCKLDYASSFDLGLVAQVFDNYLMIDDSSEFAKEIKEKKAKLYPFTTGKDGLCEWHKYFETPEVGHRHFSPLYAFYPARVIGYDTDKKLTEGVRKLFHTRLDGSKSIVGWSAAWAISLAARLREGETAKDVIAKMLKHSIFINLFDMHPPFLFQIDGNFGFVAGINEMLVTVENDVIELLPALPESWKDGKVVGMKTATAHTIDFEWKDGKIISLNIVGKNAIKLKQNSKIDAEVVKKYNK